MRQPWSGNFLPHTILSILLPLHISSRLYNYAALYPKGPTLTTPATPRSDLCYGAGACHHERWR